MEFSPSKRRKTSPTTSIPVDASTTPSRIPVRKDGATTPRSRRPSFASPTKASLARHNPQLLRRTPPAVAVAVPVSAPGSRGRNLDDVFARALETARPSIVAGNSNLGDEVTDGSTTQENEPVDEHPFFNARTQTTRPLGRALSAKPRRTSRSPFKQSPTKAFQTLVETGDLNKANPFQKTGLRRSPVGSSQETPVLLQSPIPNEKMNPFQKTGLRRSTLVSQEEPAIRENANPFGKKELRRSPVLSQEIVREKRVLRSSPMGLQEEQQENTNPFQKRNLRRSPVVVQEPVQQENANPFQKKGLARSPVSARPLAHLRQASAQPEVSTTPTEPPPRTLVLDRSPEGEQDVEQQVQQQLEQEAEQEAEQEVEQRAEIEVEQDVKPTLPQLRAEHHLSPRKVATPVLSDHPLLTDPIFSKAIEDALLSSSPVQYRASSPSAFNISRVSETEENTQDSTSFSLAIEAALSSSPTRRTGRSSRSMSQLRPDPVKPTTQRSERLPSPDIPLLNSLVADSISESQQLSSKPPEPSLLRSPARRPRRTVSPKQPEPPRSSQQPKRRARPRLAQSEEPELPLTPTQLGIDDPIVTTPPAGIHDTPGKRARRNRALGDKLKSSPLKPQNLPSQVLAEDLESRPPSKSIPKLKEPARLRRSARFLVPEDPHAAKKQERDALLRELQQLQADVALANKETERLRLQETRKSKTANPKTAEQLLAVLLRSTAPKSLSEPQAAPASIFKSIGSFLPFSSRRKQRSNVAIIDKPILSHLPIALDDPLPYLQAFSPLVYTSNITLPTPEQDSHVSTHEPVVTTLQHHAITASHPSGLFHARLNMSVDSSVPAIISLDISHLDSSADKELGTFLRMRCENEAPLNKDIGVICWAMGRWIEVSIVRARLWYTIEHELGTSEARARSFQRKKKRKHVRTAETASQDVEDDDQTRPPWTKRQLLPHMGRSALEIATDDVELRFDWSVGFDWTGEIQSSISASARVPEEWEAPDESKSLGRIPESFDRLVKQKGPLAAAKIIVGLLMPAS